MSIAPVFDFSASYDKVLLHKGQAEIELEGQSFKGECEVIFRYLPRPGIYFYNEFKNIPSRKAIRFISSFEIKGPFKFNGQDIEGFSMAYGGDALKGEISFEWCPSSEPLCLIGDNSTKIKKVVFHLFNFLNFKGTYFSRDEGKLIDHVYMNSNEWKLSLQSLKTTKKEITALKVKGGYRLTHICVVERPDESFFNGEEAYNLLDYLVEFFSFANGYSCKPICPVGFDENDNRVWELWSSPKEFYIYTPSWFDIKHSSQIEDFFPLFFKKINNNDWKDALLEIIYWYQNANISTRGLEAGIILTQAALERLAYEYCVKDKHLKKDKDFKNLWASDKILLMLNDLNIPVNIPNETPDLKALENQLRWRNALHALTEIRNSLTHPKNRLKGKLNVSVLYDAWNLFLWFLEMGILAVCGYQGTYGNRLISGRIIGQVDQVPYI